MARETSYFVQAFNAGRGGNLKADAPIACKTETGALRTAERLALSKLGVVAFSSTGDPEMGDYDDEPTVIFRKGELPSAFDGGATRLRQSPVRSLAPRLEQVNAGHSCQGWFHDLPVAF